MLIFCLLWGLPACKAGDSSLFHREGSQRKAASGLDDFSARLQKDIAAPLTRVIMSGDRPGAEALLSHDAGPRAKAMLLEAVPGNAGLLSDVRLSVERPVWSRERVLADLRGHYRYRHLEQTFPLHLRAVLNEEAKWRITDLEASPPPPWIFSHPLRATGFTRSVIVHPVGRKVDELATLVETGYAPLAGKAPGDLGRYLVVLPLPGAAQQGAGLDGEGVSVVFGWTWEGGGFTPSAPPYIAMKPQWFDEASAEERSRVVRHEVAHLVLARDTMPFTPLWLQEGLAMHFSDDLPGAGLKEGLDEFGREVDLIELTRRNRPFRALDADERRVNLRYSLSAAAVNDLISRFGERRVLDFLLAYHTALPPKEIGRVLEKKGSIGQAVPLLALSATRKLLREEFDETIEGLDARVRAAAENR